MSTNDRALSARERVLAAWPDAYAYKWGGWRDGESGFVIIRDRAEYEERLGAAKTAEKAREKVEKALKRMHPETATVERASDDAEIEEP
jgi:hypothetical protein